MLSAEQLLVAAPLEVRMEYWRACRYGARLPMLWGLVERTVSELARSPEGSWERERQKLAYVECAAMRTTEWLFDQEDPGEARRGLERPGSFYWLKWVREDRVWARIGHFRDDVVPRLCGSCGEKSVAEDEFEQISRCLACGVEAPHDELPF